jgi:ABC-type glutathione transport system ATPase component
MIEAVDIKKDFKDVKALKGVSFKIDYGESVGIMGRSGCGKTTLAKIIARLIKPDGGKVLYRGEDISRFKSKKMKIFRQKVQIVFQDPYASLDPKISIKDTLLEPLIIHKHVKAKDRLKKIRELIKNVGLRYDILDKYPRQLSGGERQRVNIARALAVEPKLLICDEPVSSLDLPIQARILRLLAELRKKENLTLLFISHDPAVVRAISDRIIHL